MSLRGNSLAVGLKAGADVLHYLQFHLHSEVELPEDLSLPPHLGCTRFSVKDVLHSPRFKPFDPLEVHPDTSEVVPPVGLNDHVI